MKRDKLVAALFVLPLTLAAAAQQGAWRALSTTARGVTGDVFFGDERLTLDFATFPIAEIRELKPAEVAAALDVAADSAGPGKLYRLSIPQRKAFLHKNTLCGADETQWMATYVSGKNLQLAFFSGSAMPVLTPEAMAGTTSLCGTYSYVR